jgi:hypothetical protein
MSRVLPKELDEAATKLADRLEPVMRDTFTRVEGLNIDYDKGQWATILAAITEKLPARLKGIPMTKEDRMEMLTMIDVVDRTVREKGADETAKTLFKSFVAMFDMFDSFRKFMRLSVKENGVDVTADIFGE